MLKKLFVGNLAFQTTENEVRDVFEPFGTVQSINLITDRATGRSKGYAFIEMEEEDAAKAIEGLSGKEFHGRSLTVNEARPLIRRNANENAGYRDAPARRSRY